MVNNMKKIIIISLLIIFCSGCKKNVLSSLDITPDGRVTLTDVFNDNDETGAYLNSCYSYIPIYGTMFYWWVFLAGFTDDAHDNDDPTENLGSNAWYAGSLSPSSDPLWLAGWGSNYQQFWQGIRKTNVFLANIGNANVTNPADRARWTAEAKILRAFYYWILIRRYGGMPIEEKPFPLGFNYATLKRSTFDSCVQFIVKNCDEAIAEPEMPWRISTGESDRGRMTKAIAYAIESEATLFNASPLWNQTNDPAKWQQAAAVSKKALTELLNNGYALYPDYYTYFHTTPDLGANPADKETIFERKGARGLDGSSNGISLINGIPSASNIKAGSSPSQELVDAYDMKNGQPAITGYSDADHLNPIINGASGYDPLHPYENRDPRFYATVLYNGAPFGKINGVEHYMQCFVGGSDGIRNNNRAYTHNGYYLRKYTDSLITNVTQGTGARWRIYRLAEIYLNLAEAENEANGPDQVAYDAVNAIRTRAGMPPLPANLSKDDFRTRVRNERRVELSFEGKRFWDVRRWKILGQTGKLTTGMQWTMNTSGGLSQERLVVDRRNAWADKFMIFPIPLSEISDMPAFKQNPGW
jgi:hypothetical protein